MQKLSLIRFASIVAGTWFLTATSTAHAEIDINTLLGNALACAITEEALAEMPVEPLYHADQSPCQAVNPASTTATQWFVDAACTIPVAFSSTRMSDYCDDSLDKASLGNGLDITAESWTLTPGNRLDVGAKPLDGVTQPYMQRRVFKTINNERGECQLEMRIYAKHPDIKNQKTLIAYHGGSWTSRGFGYFGLELSVPHFVEQGFVVFAPFYRLLGDRESTPACNQASFDQITDDAESALDWVLDNASDYGATGLPVLFGQSAGGHLAASVSLARADTISAAVLMYPPTDFYDFLARVQQGFYTNEEGLSILERVIAGPAASASLDDPLVASNSFPLRVRDDAAVTPPMMIVQGMQDELVEPRQALRLCQALSGDPLLDTATEISAISDVATVQSCGEDSSLYLVRDGNHALDVCLDERIDSVCPSGGAEARARVALIIDDAVSFADNAAAATTTSSSSSGGGSLTWWWIMPIVFLRFGVLLNRRNQLV